MPLDVTVTIDSDTIIKVIDNTYTILADSVIQTVNSPTILSDTVITLVSTKTILANTDIRTTSIQAIGANTTVVLTPAPAITSDTEILINVVELKLFKESDLSTEVGTDANPLDFGSAEAGETTLMPDNPYVLFNDKGGLINSVDARDVTLTVLQLDIIDQLLGTSNGTASQVFPVAFPPVVDDSDLIIVQVNDISWTRVSTFTASGPLDEVYTINATTGNITFGDGLQGKIPPFGNTIKATYTPNTIFYGKQTVEQLWLGVQSNTVIATTRSVPLEEAVPSDVTHVQVARAPLIVAVNGVFLGSDPFKVGTNYFTGGGFDAVTGIITLGTALPDTNSVFVDYTYTIEDDSESGFAQVGGDTVHEFANSIPANNAKKLNFRVVIPSSASPSGFSNIRFKLRITYVE